MKVKRFKFSKSKLSFINVEDYQVIISKGRCNMTLLKLRKRQLNCFTLGAIAA